MRIRSYGLVLLAAVGVAPLAVGYLSIERAEQTALAEVSAGNRQLAGQIAQRIAAYLRSERALLDSLGAAVLQTDEVAEAQGILDAYALDHQHFHRVAVYRRDRSVWAGRDGASEQSLVAAALDGTPVRSPVEPVHGEERGGFAHTMILAEPVFVAGRQEGAVVARVDLVGLWPPVNAARIGKTGFARLVTLGGELLAHGNPEERRFVFSSSPAEGRDQIARGLFSPVIENQQGREVVASMAMVPDSDWLVVVEQEVAEAFRPAAAMRRDLVVLIAVELLVVLGLVVLFGHRVVADLERLRAHTRVLAAGQLTTPAPADSTLTEVRALGGALDDMATSLVRLEDEARQRERMSVFARTAAGLAHDLKLPLQSVRSAVGELVDARDDEDAWDALIRVNRRELPLLDDFLRDLHRLARRGDIEAESVRTDPVALAEAVIEELRGRPRWGECEFVVVGQAATIEVDPRLVRRALLNLAANGAEACLAKGGGKVRLELEDVEGGLEIRVVDDGVGISPERLEGLLSADFQSTSRTLGIGLGVGIARQIVESHRGNLSVTSEQGVGTTFTIRLPRGESTRGGDDPGAERAQT